MVENTAPAKANLEVFSETLQQLAENNRDLLVVTSDSRGSGKLVPFGQKFPQQIVEVGIAEQNLVGVASGLASMEKITFAVSPACFLTARALEQIKNDVCYSDNPVNLIGISAGVSYGALGSTHHSLHDFAVLRAINNISILAPADNFETEQAIRFASSSNRPVYIRFGKKNMPLSLNGNFGENDFQFGKARTIRKGKDLTFIATGEAVLPCVEAADKLEKIDGISVNIISMHTIKPLDTEVLRQIATANLPIITVEEHSINGGLGEAIASFLLQNSLFVPFKLIGIPDEVTVSGSQQEIFDYYGISQEGLRKSALTLLNIDSNEKNGTV